MISERDFVLNKIIHSDLTSIENIDDLKLMYKTILENTSEESESNEDFIFRNNNFEVIKIRYNEIMSCGKEQSLSDGKRYVFVALYNDCTFCLIGEDIVKFKQWFERKRGK